MSNCLDVTRVRRGCPSDAPFLGLAIRESERDTHGRGIWDIYFGHGGKDQPPVTDYSSAAVASLLAEVTLKCSPRDLYHYSNFVVYEKVFSETSAYPIACGTGFRSQDSSITDTAATLSALLQLPPYSWTRAETDKALGRLNFLETSYPSDLDFENKWMIEGVYVDEAHRRKGYAGDVTSALLNEGLNKGCKDCLISCAVGNEAAFNCYKKLGFELASVEEVHSEECFAQVGCYGFNYLQRQITVQDARGPVGESRPLPVEQYHAYGKFKKRNREVSYPGGDYYDTKQEQTIGGKKRRK